LVPAHRCGIRNSWWPCKRGPILEGYFDYRPRNHQEATVAAVSTDWGVTWFFTGKALALRGQVSGGIPARLAHTYFSRPELSGVHALQHHP
jgi:hypothetical protein